MKTLRRSLFLLALLCAVLAPSHARAQGEVSFDFFYDSLSPSGEWVDVGDYGPCWRPNNVDADWTPYTDGYWAYTDAGWTWVSYEDFGGIVYHYGRWMRVEGEGWCWVPGYEWAPAWVSWRSSDDYVGWAPLPPWARWRRDVGISVWADREYDLGPGYYRFCHTRDFGAPVLRGVLIDPGQNVEIIEGTVNITNITYNRDFAGGPVIFNGGPDFATVNRLSARPIPALKLVQNTSFDPAAARNHRGSGGVLTAQTVGNQLIVAAPLVKAPANPAALGVHTSKVIAADKVSKGWGSVKSPEAQQHLRQAIQQQTKGLPATAPAHAVAATELKVVPVKADPNAKSAIAEEKHDKPAKGPRPESAVVPPANPPTAPTAGGPPLKPFNASNEPEKPKSQASTAPKGPPAADVQREQEIAAEQAKIRAEQERAAQEKQSMKNRFQPQSRRCRPRKPRPKIRAAARKSNAPGKPRYLGEPNRIRTAIRPPVHPAPAEKTPRAKTKTRIRTKTAAIDPKPLNQRSD